MSIWIKNTTGATKNYAGRDIFAGAYREIENNLPGWQNSSSLLTDIGNGDAVVSKDDSGNTDIVKVSDAVLYLLDEHIKKVTQTSMIDPDGKRARLKGAILGTVPKGTTVNFDYQMEQLQYAQYPYTPVDKTSIFNGIQYYAKNAEVGDTITFQVVIISGETVTLIEEFGDGWYVAPDKLEDIILYRSGIVPGIFLRVKYTSVGTTSDVEFFMNLYRHLEE